MLAVLLALGAAGGWGGADFLGGNETRRLPVLTVSLVSQAVGFAFVLGLVVSSWNGLPDARTVTLGLAAGLLGAVGLAALYSALAIGPMAVVAPMVSLSVIVPVAAGLMSGERPAALQMAGVAAAIGGVTLAARHRDETGGRVSARAIALAAVAAVSLGLLAVFLSRAGATDVFWSVLMVRIGSLTLLGAAALVRRPSFVTSTRQRLTLASVGVLDSGSNLLFVLASQRGLLSLVAVVASLYPVVTVLLARGVLGERLSRIQAAGVALSLAGIALIAAG
jgi:drug/metabolite transporter (DMT)-like permease